MNAKRCPYLGLKEDPTTSLNFPSNEGNYCHHANPVAPVNAGHQRLYCLTGRHAECPIYKAAQPVPLPAKMSVPVQTRPAYGRYVPLLGLLLVAGVTALSSVLSPITNINGIRAGLIPQTGQEQQVPGWGLFNFNRQPASAPSAANTPVPETVQQPTSCALPNGFTPYVVTPTDSLFRLSVVYQTSIEDLQRANCLGDRTVILPGQVLYVPILPTAEPTATATKVPPIQVQQQEVNPPAPAPVEPQPVNNSDNNPPPQPQPQPTAVPPTSVPVVDNPPPQPEPQQPQPTSKPPENPPPPDDDDDEDKDKDKDKDKDDDDEDNDDEGGGDEGGNPGEGGGGDDNGGKDKDKDKDKGKGEGEGEGEDKGKGKKNGSVDTLIDNITEEVSAEVQQDIQEIFPVIIDLLE